MIECAARSERAHSLIAESVARAEAARADLEASRVQHEKAIDSARRKQEEATARIEAASAKFEKLRPVWEQERAEFRKNFEESRRKTDQTLTELKDGRDERRAMLEALLRVMDRLSPPPPNLRSA
jgi:chromosome segregation ATPase